MENQELVFSFKHYDTSLDARYCLSKWTQAQVKDALYRLSEVNRKSFLDLLRQSRIWHFHEVDWSQTTQRTGFPGTALDQLPHFQFELPGVNSGKARVFGAYQKGVFFIVWFDLNHEIWPSLLKHT